MSARIEGVTQSDILRAIATGIYKASFQETIEEHHTARINLELCIMHYSVDSDNKVLKLELYFIIYDAKPVLQAVQSYLGEYFPLNILNDTI